jgi:hypothetical protein
MVSLHIECPKWSIQDENEFNYIRANHEEIFSHISKMTNLQEISIDCNGNGLGIAALTSLSNVLREMKKVKRITIKMERKREVFYFLNKHPLEDNFICGKGMRIFVESIKHLPLALFSVNVQFNMINETQFANLNDTLLKFDNLETLVINGI